jgi:hypothetical protein
MSGPCKDYIYKYREDQPGKEVGYDAVGPGWTHLLEAVDNVMVGAVKHAVQHATVVREEYRDEECKADAEIKVLQIKEKFGGLRIYWKSKGLGTRLKGQVMGACMMAEGMALKTCERCGSRENVDTRRKKDSKWGRLLTLCATCQEKRDNAEVFEMGNGDKI